MNWATLTTVCFHLVSLSSILSCELLSLRNKALITVMIYLGSVAVKQTDVALFIVLTENRGSWVNVCFFNSPVNVAGK